MGYWKHWLIGAKMIIASIVGGIVTALAYGIVRLAIMSGRPALYALSGIISVAMFIFLTIYLNGLLANKFWNWK